MTEVDQMTKVIQKSCLYVPPFLKVRANDLMNWFTTTISARTKLSVLLRTLIHSTGHDLQKVDFPGNDDAERAGWMASLRPAPAHLGYLRAHLGGSSGST